MEKWKKEYDDLISSVQSKKRGLDRDGRYYNIHHILPRSLGGSDDKSNLVKLTHEEHYEAHRLLYEIHKNCLNQTSRNAMAYAWKMMSEKVTCSSEEYAKAKEAHSLAMKRFHANRSKEDKETSKERQRNSIRNRTTEEDLVISKRRSDGKRLGYARLSPSEKEDRNKKLKIGHSNRTLESEAKRRHLISISQQNRSEEKKKKRESNWRETMSKKTPEDKLKSKQKQADSVNRQTDKKKAEISKKRSESAKRAHKLKAKNKPKLTSEEIEAKVKKALENRRKANKKYYKKLKARRAENEKESRNGET